MSLSYYMLAKYQPGTAEHNKVINAIYVALMVSKHKLCHNMATYLRIVHMSPDSPTYPADEPLPPDDLMLAIDALFSFDPDTRLRGYNHIGRTANQVEHSMLN
jgi:hypothetical protein